MTTDLDLDLPGLRLRPELLAAGLSDDDLARLCRSGGLGRVRRGAYVDAADERLRSREARHALATRAAIRQLRPGTVASHVSAAVLHGLPAWDTRLDRVHVTRDGLAGGRRRRTLHVHVRPLGADDVTTVGGVPATAVARTLADVARSESFASAVAIVDAALRRQLVDPGALDRAVDLAARRHGVGTARRVMAFADAGAQSVGESRSRVLLDRARLPRPALQWEVPGCRPLGPCDFGWPELRTVGEFDGGTRYGRLLRPGQDPAEAVLAERRREDAIRRAGFILVRWTWDDLEAFDEVVERLLAAFAARGRPGDMAAGYRGRP